MSHHEDCVEMLGRGIDAMNKLLIPQEILEAILDYRDERKPFLNAFLSAVLQNDLVAAVACSDRDTILTIPSVVSFCLANMPPGSWGSREAVLLWLGLPVGEESSPGLTVGQSEALLAIAAIAEEVQNGISEFKEKDPRALRYARIQKLLSPFLGQPNESKEETKEAPKEPVGQTSGQ